jgi:hypothetical protein
MPVICAVALTLAICASCFSSGCAPRKRPAPSAQPTFGPPFSLSIVSARRDGITMFKHGGREFFVVLTNVSNEPQPVFEYWNSWGYQAISFNLTIADGKFFVLTTKSRDFDMNFPSRFIVMPGEHQVFPVRLDESWRAQPAIPSNYETPIALKAIYSVDPSPESIKYGVWTGRVESLTYNLTLSQD